MEYYYDFFANTAIVLRVDWRGRFLLAPKWYKPIKPIYRAYDFLLEVYWKSVRKLIRRCAKRGWLKPEEGERICWSSLVKWYKSARVNNRP